MSRPAWLSAELYPFESRTFESTDGTMHYVHEGSGDALLMVHGTPTWSFLYRELISRCAAEYRVLAVDHLGFGLSEKPADAPYRPADHARRLAAFIEHVDVAELTLVVHDYGGPIGLSWALDHPDRVPRLVLFNTWLWPLETDRRVRIASALLGGPLGRLFYRWYNGSPKVLLKAAWGDETPLTEEVHRHHTAPFPTPDDRYGPWTLARELLGSTAWYGSLWDRRDAILDIPTLVMWGLADPTFGDRYLDRWEDALTDADVHRLPGVGHFVPDEAARRVTPELVSFLADS